MGHGKEEKADSKQEEKHLQSQEAKLLILERQCHKVVRLLGFQYLLPGFESQFYHLAGCLQESCLTSLESQFHHLQN